MPILRSFRLCVLLLVMPAAAAAPLAAAPSAAAPDGWQDLFNGKDPSGWQNREGKAPGPGWVVEEGAIARKARAGDIWSKARFGNFVLDLEFKTEGNSGIFIRTDDPRNNVQTGIEIQVLPPSARPSKHSCGSIYDCLAPTKEMTSKDQWNRMVIAADKNRITVEMNGHQIIDMDLDRWTEPGKNPDGSKNKFQRALKDFKREGHIGLQDHGAGVSYRNIRIKPR